MDDRHQAIEEPNPEYAVEGPWMPRSGQTVVNDLPTGGDSDATTHPLHQPTFGSSHGFNGETSLGPSIWPSTAATSTQDYFSPGPISAPLNDQPGTIGPTTAFEYSNEMDSQFDQPNMILAQNTGISQDYDYTRPLYQSVRPVGGSNIMASSLAGTFPINTVQNVPPNTVETCPPSAFYYSYGPPRRSAAQATSETATDRRPQQSYTQATNRHAATGQSQDWIPQETLLLASLHLLHGNDWNVIASKLEGRTPQACQAEWARYMREELKR